MLEVRRISRVVTIRTSQGVIERIVVPRETQVQSPRGSNSLSGIRSGMVIHVDGALSQDRIVAKKIVAH